MCPKYQLSKLAGAKDRFRIGFTDELEDSNLEDPLVASFQASSLVEGQQVSPFVAAEQATIAGITEY